MFYSHNPFGMELVDFDEATAAERTGKRIRKIRESQTPKMSQKVFGDLVGLNANRIQQYENGARKPKLDLLKKMAQVLNINAKALTDPQTESVLGLMFTLFELEDLYDLQLKNIDGRIYLCFANNDLEISASNLNTHLHIWHEKIMEKNIALENAETTEEKQQIISDYHHWQWNFPDSLTTKKSKEQKKKLLEMQIQALQDELNQLSEE